MNLKALFVIPGLYGMREEDRQFSLQGARTYHTFVLNLQHWLSGVWRSGDQRLPPPDKCRLRNLGGLRRLYFINP